MKQWKKALLAVILFGMIGAMVPSYALDNMTVDPNQPVGYENVFNRVTRKFGRGICNLAFGVLEIPIQMSKVQFNDGAIACASFGLFQGIGYFLVREGVGLVELLTFPVPLEGCPNDPNDPNQSASGYGPILTPEWVISPKNDYKSLVYPQTGIIN